MPARAPHVTLEQWRALMAVVDAGGYAQAAGALHKSQSAVTYAVQKLESQLGVKAFEIQGRKAVLTPTGQLLYRRARALLDEAGGAGAGGAGAFGRAGRRRSASRSKSCFRPGCCCECLDRFGAESPHTRIEVVESVLGGTGRGAAAGPGRSRDLAAGAAGLPGRSADALSRDSGRASASIRCTGSAAS